jgi:hypothetical protein
MRRDRRKGPFFNLAGLRLIVSFILRMPATPERIENLAVIVVKKQETIRELHIGQKTSY